MELVVLVLVGVLLWATLKHFVPLVRLLRNGYCRVCGEPNAVSHGCHIFVTSRGAGSYKKFYGPRLGSLRKVLWKGVVYDRHGDVWECGHKHEDRHRATACAAVQVRRFQVTGEALPPVARRRPSTLRVRRLPISDLSPRAWERLQAKHGHCCFYCGADGVPLEKEHLIPLSRGGANSAANIVPACGPCNRRKGVLTDEEFRSLRLDEAERQRLRTARGTASLKRPHESPSPTRTLIRKRRLLPGETTRAVRRFEAAVQPPPVEQVSGTISKPSLPAGMKRCVACKQVLSIDAFGSNRSRGDGLDNRCRSCATAASRRWKAENPAKVKASRRTSRTAERERNKAAGFAAEAKTCPACGEHKDAGAFHRDSGRPDGLQRKCKACRSMQLGGEASDQRKSPPE